ncbi:hypothetical protein C5167_031719 [Papaver somniferum]|uniref:Uncharacterized protein n=1 Tax=Papaver somniferum TaxID=3469 RepID=A0A4Y7K835_PAPSO|nr:hypothetical protein C5167_031719 [Papaver somniferum]
MYATRPLALYRRDPSILSTLTKGLAFQVEDTCCWGTCKDPTVEELPFPHNKLVTVVYTMGSAHHRRTRIDKVCFIPVLDQPLSSNRFYVITASGKYKGQTHVEFELDFSRQTCTCSTEKDMTVCCFCNVIKDVKRRVFDHRDIYQQVEGGGFRPQVHMIVIWLKILVSMSLYSYAYHQILILFIYLVRFPHLWLWENAELEEIYTCENFNSASNFVFVNVTLQKETIRFFGNESKKNCSQGGGGFIWYRHVNYNIEGSELGLSAAIVERMKWFKQQGGYEIKGENKDVRVEKVFRFFVLAERFTLRRIDGTLFLTCDYKHIHKTRRKWD